MLVVHAVPSAWVPIDEKQAATTGVGVPLWELSTYVQDSPPAQSPAPRHTPWQSLPIPSCAQSLAWHDESELQLLPS